MYARNERSVYEIAHSFDYKNCSAIQPAFAAN
jgi:hypothetical protein